MISRAHYETMVNVLQICTHMIKNSFCQESSYFITFSQYIKTITKKMSIFFILRIPIGIAYFSVAYFSVSVYEYLQICHN